MTWQRRVLAGAAGLLVALGLGEGLLRLFAPTPRPRGELYFRTSAGERVDMVGAWQEAARRGLVEILPPAQTPRPRARFAPGAHFFMCYSDAERLDADWLDGDGCVEVRINRYGLREREDLEPQKPAGQRRVVCIGDSFTFGWGVPIEQCWVRLLEDDLRTDLGDVRTVNCGASGALCVDEYEWGLRTRFGRFEPDVVVVSIYLNDLIPSDGLCILQPQPRPSGLRLWDYGRAVFGRDPLDLDPSIDWVDVALQLPEAIGTAQGHYGPDKPFAAMWSQGAPQRALVAMRSWCQQHNCILLVTLWPFLQGLGSAAEYPFHALHARVQEYCHAQGIPLLDLLPVLDVEPADRLWVTPADMHANPRAQRLVTPAINAFVRAHWPR